MTLYSSMATAIDFQLETFDKQINHLQSGSMVLQNVHFVYFSSCDSPYHVQTCFHFSQRYIFNIPVAYLQLG
jgi:hypothetical protein